ncbi:MAG: leucine-rich repeat protein [Prevotella sp.]|nr:leucine-rich repeat protein [Candidatus Prevotella equi]
MKRNQFFSCKGIQMMLLAVMMLLPAMTCKAETITESNGLKIKYKPLYFHSAYVIGLADDNQDATEITIPAKYMGMYPITDIEGFEGTKIKTVKFESRDEDAPSVYINYRAFANCQNLTTVDFGNAKVWRIDVEAFNGSSLSVLKNYEYLGNIGRGAFENCTNLTSFTIYGALERIESKAFYNSGLMYLTINSWNPDLNRTIEKDNVFYLENHELNCGLGKEIFARTKLTEVPKVIGHYTEGMFESCKWLHTVNIPASVTDIPENCFFGTDNLNTLVIPSTVKTIGHHAFSDILNLTINSDKVVNIDDGAYLRDRFGNEVTDLTLDGIVRIGNSWASGAEKLKNLTIKDHGIRIGIGKNAFSDCTSLPSTMTFSKMNIHQNAFQNSSITDLTLNSCELNQDALKGTHLQSLTLNDAYLYSYALRGCNAEDVVIDNFFRVGDATNMFTGMNITGGLNISRLSESGDLPAYSFEGSNMQYLRIKGGMNIGTGAFRSCAKLADVKFDQYGATINSEAFANCPELLSMTLGDNVIVKKNAFKGSFLASDYSEIYGSSDLTINKLANLEEGALNGAKFRTINVLDVNPTGNVLRYTATKWIDFKNATTLEGTGMLEGSTVEAMYAKNLQDITQKAIGGANNLRNLGTIKNEYISTTAFELGCVYSADRKTLLFICPGMNEALLAETVEKIDLRGTDITAPGDRLKCGVPVIDARAITDHKVTPINDDGTHACAKYIRVATGCRKYFAEFEKIKNFYTPTLVQDYIQGDVNDDGQVSVADVMNVYDQLK